MESTALIYQNNYGASYKVVNHFNPKRTVQMVIGSVGIFMTEPEILNLLSIVRRSDVPCNCDQCQGDVCGKIWTSSSLIDTCIKVDDTVAELLEDLILGTLFMRDIDSILDEHKIN